MTQPTQAQIEAIENSGGKLVGCLCKSREDQIGPMFIDTGAAVIANLEGYAIIPREEYAALTAAAQAGDVEWARQNLQEVRQQACGLDPLTIERCKQVVRDHLKDSGYELRDLEIIAALDKLKDAP